MWRPQDTEDDTIADWSPQDLDEDGSTEKTINIDRGVFMAAAKSNTSSTPGCQEFDQASSIDICNIAANLTTYLDAQDRQSHMDDQNFLGNTSANSEKESCDCGNLEANHSSGRQDFHVIWSGLTSVALISPAAHESEVNHSYVCDQDLDTDWSLVSEEHEPLNDDEVLSDVAQNGSSAETVPAESPPDGKVMQEQRKKRSARNDVPKGCSPVAELESEDLARILDDSGLACKRMTRSEIRKLSDLADKPVIEEPKSMSPIPDATPKPKREYNTRRQPEREMKRKRSSANDEVSPSHAASSISSPNGDIAPVEVLTDGDWWEAYNIGERADGCICIRYVGGSPSEDEWIPRHSARIRPPQDAARLARERRYFSFHHAHPFLYIQALSEFTGCRSL